MSINTLLSPVTLWKRNTLFLLIMIGFAFGSCDQEKSPSNPLREKIMEITKGKKAVVEVSVIGPNPSDTLSINGDRHSALQSVFKFHISLAMLSEIDKGTYKLDETITIKKEELMPADMYSPLRDEHPEGGVFTIAELIEYAIVVSDNQACDKLIELLGSPKAVEAFIKKSGIEDIAIVHNEVNMQAKWENMFDNWSTAKALSKTLQIFYNNENNLLSKSSYDFFWNTMKSTETGQGRLRAGLPENTPFAHKTGTSGDNEAGLSAATNDVGIVFLPNGQHYIISVLVTDSYETSEVNEKLMADISKVVYDKMIALN